MGEKKRHCQRGETSTSKPCPTYNYSKTSSDHAKMTQQDTPPKPAWFGVKTGWSFSLGEFSHLFFFCFFFSTVVWMLLLVVTCFFSLKTHEFSRLENPPIFHFGEIHRLIQPVGTFPAPVIRPFSERAGRRFHNVVAAWMHTSQL